MLRISFLQSFYTPARRVGQVSPGSGGRAAGHSRRLRSRLERSDSRDDLHRQDLLRPESHHAGGGLGGLQRATGTRGPHRECGLSLRHHPPGLQRAQPAADQVPPSAGGPGLPL